MTTMHAGALHVGDRIHHCDWWLAVVAEPDEADGNVAVAVAPGFLMHYPADVWLDVDQAVTR